MDIRKKLVYMAGVLLCAALLCACGKAGDDRRNVPEKRDETESTSREAAVDEKAAVAGEAVAAGEPAMAGEAATDREAAADVRMDRGYDLPIDARQREEAEADCFDPDSGELVLGDIILSVDKVREQAESYGHSRKREYAFLVAHSMLHLCGYDHMEEGEAAVMEEKQRNILKGLRITREEIEIEER